MAKKIECWEIFDGEEYVGTTTSLQIAEAAVDKGLVVQYNVVYEDKPGK